VPALAGSPAGSWAQIKLEPAMVNLKSSIVATVLVAASSGSAVAADQNVGCRLMFATNEWSAVYASASGTGEVACDNGKFMPVIISAKGVGLTAGKWEIQQGKGRFTQVGDIDDTLGSYFGLSANIGLAKAGTAQVFSKGGVSLTLTGTGQGFDIGISINSFTITKATENK
jgi:hypothetical protein